MPPHDLLDTVCIHSWHPSAVGEQNAVAVVAAPDDATLGAALLQLAGTGNLRTKTLRAFDEGEMQALLGQLG